MAGHYGVVAVQWFQQLKTYPIVVVVVLTLTHRCLVNAVRDHKTASNNSGVEDYFRRKKNKTIDIFTDYKVPLRKCVTSNPGGDAS